MNIRLLIGLTLGFGIGFLCRVLGIPSPAPTELQGALLVIAMTVGYLLGGLFVGALADPPAAPSPGRGDGTRRTQRRP